MPEKLYVIRKDGKNGISLFLVDRRITNKYWWTANPNEAIKYCDLKAANEKADSLSYGEPYVDSFENAILTKK